MNITYTTRLRAERCPWTSGEDALLLAARDQAQPMSWLKISRMLNRSRNGCKMRFHMLKSATPMAENIRAHRDPWPAHVKFDDVRMKPMRRKSFSATNHLPATRVAGAW